MARITTHYKAQAAFDYYIKNYYEQSGPQFDGQWLGNGAKMLGLDGDVQPEAFMRLLKNRHPFDNSKLSPRDYDHRRIGWDINFNIPKSVSVVYGINNDDHIIAALRESVGETLNEMERDVMTRVNQGRTQHHVKTGNMIAGVWIHPDARAVGEAVPDPNLHAHAFVSNHTWALDRWTAADISNLFRDAQGYYEASFQAKFCEEIQDLGYEIERSQHNFEIAGVSRTLIDKFSKRTSEIDYLIKEEKVAAKIANKEGISLEDAKGRVGAISRQAKTESYSLDDLQKNWRTQLSKQEAHDLAVIDKQKDTAMPTGSSITAKEAVDYALENRFEKEAVVRERDVLRDAFLFGIGGNTVEQIKNELANRDLIREGKDEAAILTTAELQREELEILNFAKHGRGRVNPLATGYQSQNPKFSQEQQKVVNGLMNSPDRLQLLRGVAGTGKSTLLKELKPAIEKTGKTVAIMAPTNKATSSLKTDGFDASTIKSFINDKERQQQLRGAVIVVDESGLVDSPTFLELVKIAKEQQARIIAVGDARQHSPVGRGHPIRLLENQAGIRPKEITEIYRQKGKYKQAVAALSRGEIESGFKQLKDLEFVHEIDDEKRDQTLAKAYADAKVKFPKQKQLVIAPTHAERRQITGAIRTELKSRKLIKGKERELDTFVDKQLSTAKRRDPLNYQIGDVVAFHGRGRGGIKPGEKLTVNRVTQTQVFAEGNQEIPLESAGAFQLFRPETANYAKGDVIRLTRGRRRTDNTKELVNGSLHSIRSINRGVVTLENGEKLRRDFRFFDHGVAVTSYISQGTTVHRAYVAASSMSFPASSPEQMYVSASRAKIRVDIFTDSTDGLERAISRFRPKKLATDVKHDPTLAAKQDSPDVTPQLPARGRFNRIKAIAHRFATKQLKRFYDWLPAKQLEPELRR